MVELEDLIEEEKDRQKKPKALPSESQLMELLQSKKKVFTFDYSTVIWQYQGEDHEIRAQNICLEVIIGSWLGAGLVSQSRDDGVTWWPEERESVAQIHVWTAVEG